mgnify:CR=1 FL=1
MKNSQLVIPSDALHKLCSSYQVRELSLFGSALTDDFTPDSDVDLLVDFQPQAKIGLLALARMQRELSGLLHRQVDLVPKNGLKAKIRNAVISGAEVLYAA